YLAHGLTTMTTVALLGTLSSLALTAVLARVFVALTELTGFGTEEATVVSVGAAQVDLAGILLGGVVIGALGAIDDMTVTQASAVWELRSANPRMDRTDLTRAGLRIGRDHVASTVNTLALAYAGASMPVLLLLVLSRQSIGTVLSGEVIATEIVRTLVGSIGLVTAVPITTWLAAWTAGGPDESGDARAGAGPRRDEESPVHHRDPRDERH
ncbi:MAG TPA: YibE/F family protein, partial [Actinomycetota bacterium]|nr:YibE/F family protein [Actinomycetota bacterium]